MELRVVKTRPYVWRTQLGGQFHWHAHMTVWNVVNENDDVVYGGYDSGNNTRSGTSYVKRMRDAKAFIAGYKAVAEGLQYATFSNKAVDRDGRTYVDTFSLRAVNPHKDDYQAREAWEDGVEFAHAERIGVRRSFRKIDAVQA